MATERTAAEIMSRFETDQDYIRRYVDFLLARSTITDRQIADLVRILKKYRLPLLHRRQKPPPGPREFTAQDLADLLASVERITPIVEAATRQQTLFVDEFVIPPEPDPGVHVPEAAREWVNEYMKKLGYNLTPRRFDACRGVVKQMLEADTGLDFTQTTNEAGLDYLMTIAMQEHGRRKLERLQHVLVRLGELRLLARVLIPETEINVLRQGFILLMTAFDAAVFDLVRVKLRKDFFGLIGAFGKNGKVTLQEIGDSGSFEVFREKIIEEQLKSRYIKDLLFLLESLGIKCIDETTGDRFIQLIELVLRRNIHIHNRGVVDERYLERDQQGQPKYNLYNLSLGEVARIDEPYWELASRLCARCVIRVADWASA